jgi:hypothetical protein
MKMWRRRSAEARLSGVLEALVWALSLPGLAKVLGGLQHCRPFLSGSRGRTGSKADVLGASLQELEAALVHLQQVGA